MYLRKKEAIFLSDALASLFTMLFVFENLGEFIFAKLFNSLDDLFSRGFFSLFYFYVTTMVGIFIEVLVPFLRDLRNIDSFWAFLGSFFFLGVFAFSLVKEYLFEFLIYYRDKSELLNLLSKNILLDLHDFSVFHDWHRIFKHTWGCRYNYVEIIDEFITRWYRAYRRSLRTLTYPLPCVKKIALYLKKNFYFVRTRT